MPALINILVVGSGCCVLCVLCTGASVPVMINILVVAWLAAVYCVYSVLELLSLS